MFLADSNGDGIDDGDSASNGDDPNAPAEDRNNDGVPDNVYYTPILEVTQETKAQYTDIGFGTVTNANSRYLSQTERFTYSVSNSPTMDTIIDGEKKKESTYLQEDTGKATNQISVEETGEDYATWRDAHTHPFSTDPLEYLESAWPTITHPQTPPVVTSNSIETTSTWVSTRAWKIKRASAPNQSNSEEDEIVRSGTETITLKTIVKKFDPTSYEDVWNDVVKDSSWDGFVYPEVQGPLKQIDQGIGAVGEIEAALAVRDSFRLGLGAMNGTISSPGGSAGGGSDERLKRVRWRWARFNPNDPFNYDFAAPPASYQKNFKLLVRQEDYTDTPQTNPQTESKSNGIINIGFTGSQGQDWSDLSLGTFNSYQIDEPSNLPNIGYNGNTGRNTISFGNVPVKLTFDGNRNGILDTGVTDLTTQVKPFRFWINNDQDNVEVDEPVIVDVNSRDLLDEQIKTKRDLEDFARLRLQIYDVDGLLATGEIKLGLKFINITEGSPQIRVWKNPHTPADDSYIYNGSYAAYYLSKSPLSPNMDGMIVFPQSYWTNSNQSNYDLIFEGIRKGKGELVAVLLSRAGNELGQSEGQCLHLLNVKEMYQRARIANHAEQIPHPWSNPNPPAQTWQWDPNGNPYVEDPNAEKVTAIFVHGWRLSYEEYLNWSDTSYKRLWHQGFKGQFYSFRWATYSPSILTYNDSEYRAWLCGPAFAQFVNQLPNPSTKRNIFAHSMGNVLAGVALRAGMVVENYALCNSAMAAMAYDSSPALQNIPNTNAPLTQIWGNLGPQKTPDTDPQANIRSTFGLQNKFNESPSMPRMFSFVLPDDSALGLWVLNNQLSKPDSSGHSYYYQETPIAPNLAYKLFQTPLSGQPRPVNFQPEAFGYVTKSLTRAAGAESRTSGAIDGVHNMASWGSNASHAGFGSEHSAQWKWNNQSTHLFWRMLSDELQLNKK